MARLGIDRNAERRKRIAAVLTMWLEMCVVVIWFLNLLSTNILEDIAVEENVEINEGTEHENQFELGSDDMDISSRVPQLSTSSKRKRKASEIYDSIAAATLLGDKLSEMVDKLSDSLGSERILQQKFQELDGALSEIEGLTKDEMDIALNKIPDHPNQMLVFFSLPPGRRLRWVRRFLGTH